MFSLILNPENYAFNPYAVPVLVTAMSIFLLGVVVLILERKASTSLSFFLLTFMTAAWLFSFSWMYFAINKDTALMWVKIAYLAVPSIPSAVYLFTTEILKKRRQRKWILRITWTLSLLFIIAIFNTHSLIGNLRHYSWGYYPQYHWLGIPYLTFFFGVMILTLIEYWKEYQRTTSHIHEIRIKSFLTAFVIGYLGSLDYLAKYGIALYPFGYIPIFIFVVIAARTIVRYHLVDITPSLAANEIIATMADPLIVCDPEGKIRVVNRAACLLSGRREKVLLGEPLESLLAPSRDILYNLDQILKAHKVPEQEMIFLTREGEEIPVSVSMARLSSKNKEDTSQGAVIIARDIRENKRIKRILENAYKGLEERVDERTLELAKTNQKLKSEIVAHQKAQEALQQSEQQYRLLFEKNPHPMWVYDEKALRFLAVNRVAVEHYGYSEEEFLKRTLHDIYAPEKTPNPLEQVTQHHGLTSEGIRLHQKKDGTKISVEITSNSILFQGSPAILVLANDVTERLKMDHMKSEFISTVSHELKTPLTSIQGALEIINHKMVGEIPEQAVKMIDIAFRNCERLVRLINDLLDTQKIEAGRMDFNKKTMDLVTLVTQAIDINKTFASQFSVQFELKNHLPPGIKVHVDSDRFTQALTNLLSNGAKFSPSKDQVTVSLEPLDQKVRISVTNHGPQIPASFQNHLFEKFSQEDTSNTRQRSGTGLGLWITKEIIEKLGGKIGFQSEKDGQTTFYIDLPIWPLKEIQAETKSSTLRRFA